MIRSLLQHFSIKIKHCMLWFFKKETFYTIECINVQLCWWLSINHNSNKTEGSSHAVVNGMLSSHALHYFKVRLHPISFEMCVRWVTEWLVICTLISLHRSSETFFLSVDSIDTILWSTHYPFHGFSLYVISNDQAAYNLFILYFQAFTAVSLSLHALRC